MEANRRQCTETASLALRTIATTCSGGNEKGAHRTVTGVRRGSNHFSESLRAKVGARGIRAYDLRKNPCPDPHTHGEMGQETQETYGHEGDSRARKPSQCRARAPRSQCLIGHPLFFYRACAVASSIRAAASCGLET